MILFFVEDTALDLQSISSVPNWLTHIARLHNHSIGNINYIFCSDDYLLKINIEYLSHNYYTDIITFDNRDTLSDSIESDIFISVDRVRDNAETLKVSFLHELLRVLVHGLLHLLGFSDKSDSQRAIMRSLESDYLTLYLQDFSHI